MSSSSYKDTNTNSIMKVSSPRPNLNLVTSQMSHLQVPLHWAIGLQCMFWGADTTIQCITIYFTMTFYTPWLFILFKAMESTSWLLYLRQQDLLLLITSVYPPHREEQIPCGWLNISVCKSEWIAASTFLSLFKSETQVYKTWFGLFAD